MQVYPRDKLRVYQKTRFPDEQTYLNPNSQSMQKPIEGGLPVLVAFSSEMVEWLKHILVGCLRSVNRKSIAALQRSQIGLARI